MTSRLRTRVALAVCLAALIACAPSIEDGGRTAETEEPADMDRIAEQYVKLVLALGEHDADYVDAYYGPPEWREAVKAEHLELTAIGARAGSLIGEIEALPTGGDAMDRLRREYLEKQLSALAARVEILGGRKMTFDEESKALFDAAAPVNTDDHFQAALDEMEGLLPGKGPLVDRYESFKKDFIIPKEKLDAVFLKAIEACRERTVRRLELPPGESFTIEYVTDKPWSGYNWYQGGYKSLIQVNTDLPIYIDRAIDLACHEGYPGHHVYNVLLEWRLTKERGWKEFTVYPLFSPQSLIAEGSANYGIEMSFPGDERAAYDKEILFPLASLDPSRAETYYKVLEIAEKLGYAGNESARRYLDGRIDAAGAVEHMTRYGLYPRKRAEQRVRFIDKYRSYVINYNLGKDLVREYVERKAGEDPDSRWRIFGELLSSPRLPSGLR